MIDFGQVRKEVLHRISEERCNLFGTFTDRNVPTMELYVDRYCSSFPTELGGVHLDYIVQI